VKDSILKVFASDGEALNASENKELSEMTFTSVEEAIQHLSDTTGKSIKISTEEDLKFANKNEAIQYLASVLNQRVIVGFAKSDYSLDEKDLEKYPKIKEFGSKLLDGKKVELIMIDIDYPTNPEAIDILVVGGTIKGKDGEKHELEQNEKEELNELIKDGLSKEMVEYLGDE